MAQTASFEKWATQLPERLHAILLIIECKGINFRSVGEIADDYGTKRIVCVCVMRFVPQHILQHALVPVKNEKLRSLSYSCHNLNPTIVIIFFSFFAELVPRYIPTHVKKYIF
jgi:hypothetical protein